MLRSDYNTVKIERSPSLIAAELEQLLRSAREVLTESLGKELADSLMNYIWENSKQSV